MTVDRDILAREDKRCAAMTGRDADALAALLHDDLVRAYGDTAFVTGRAEIEVDVNGQHKSLRLRYLDAWTRTPQGWKFVAWQWTGIPQ